MHKVDKIVKVATFHDIVIGGDFNWDQRRNTRFSRIMDEFMSKYGLVSIWNKFPADFTYQHTNLISFSVIDHFFVTERFLDNCVDASPIHLGDNKSSHSPIMIKINLPQIEGTKSEVIISVLTPSWKNASEEDVSNFSAIFQEKIS